jgi:ATP-dependent Clp protease ATP-binding subunit ClpC
LRERIQELGYDFSLTDEAKEFLVQKGFDPKFGARPLRRAIQKYLEDKIAEELLKAELKEGDSFLVSHEKDKEELTVDIKKGEEEKAKETKE